MPSLTVCVSASSTDGALAPLVDLQALLGATSSEEDYSPFEIGQQQAALRRASAWAETYIGQPLLAQVYSERLDGLGLQTLMLARTPIRALLRVFDSTSTESATVFTSSEVYVDDAQAGTMAFTNGSPFPWTPRLDRTMGLWPAIGTEPKTWLVEYQAGYIGPSGTTSTAYGTSDTGPTLPEDLVDGVLLKAAEILRGGDGRVLSKKVGDLQLTYQGRTADLRTEAEERLQPFRRVV